MREYLTDSIVYIDVDSMVGLSPLKISEQYPYKSIIVVDDRTCFVGWLFIPNKIINSFNKSDCVEIYGKIISSSWGNYLYPDLQNKHAFRPITSRSHIPKIIVELLKVYQLYREERG